MIPQLANVVPIQILRAISDFFQLNCTVASSKPMRSRPRPVRYDGIMAVYHGRTCCAKEPSAYYGQRRIAAAVELELAIDSTSIDRRYQSR